MYNLNHYFINIYKYCKIHFNQNERFLITPGEMPKNYHQIIRKDSLIIKNFVSNLKNDLSTIKNHQSALIFTGLTGSGKGALIHYLMKNNRLYAQYSETGDMIIKLRANKYQQNQKISISDKMSSDTSIPHQIQFRGQVYRDLPGFMDNRVDQKFIPQDIINSFYIHDVYQKTKRVKIIFTASKNSLTDRATQFIKSLNNFTERFIDVTKIIDSIFLVVTKVPSNLQMKHINFILQNILSDLSKEIPQKTRLLLDKWIRNQSMVELFKIPEKQGPLNLTQSQKIFNKIKKMPYSQSPQIKSIVSQHSQTKIIQLQEKWNSQIGNICYQLIQSNYEQYLKKIKKIKMLNAAKSNLNYLRHKLDQLMQSQSPYQFIKRLKNIPDLCKNRHNTQSSKSQQLMRQFENYYQFLLIFSKLQSSIMNILKWKEPLYKIHHSISQLVSQPWQEIHGEDIYIKGFVVQSAVVEKKLQLYKSMKRPSKSKVVVFAYFFIMNQDIEFHGTNMMIYAQYFNVQNSVSKIRLNGQNAKDYSAFIADNNKNGLPGKPGQNGGNFLLKVYEKCQNIQNFSIDLRGGRGGRGMNGGQIKIKQINNYYLKQLQNDKSLQTSKKKYLMYRQDYKFSQRNIFSKVGQILRILGTYNGQVVQFYSTEVEADENINKFKYTLGGKGGNAGHSGAYHIEIGDQTVCIIDKPQQSLNGQGHLQVYEGLYMKQMIFANFRQEGREMNIKQMVEQHKLKEQYQKVQNDMNNRRQKKIQRLNKTLSGSTNKTMISDSSENGSTFSVNPQQLKQIVRQAKQQIQQQQQLATPLRYKTKYKQQTEYIQQDSIIQEQNQQQEQPYQNLVNLNRKQSKSNIQPKRKVAFKQQLIQNNIQFKNSNERFIRKNAQTFQNKHKIKDVYNKNFQVSSPSYITRRWSPRISPSTQKINVSQSNNKYSVYTDTKQKTSLRGSQIDRTHKKPLNKLVQSISKQSQKSNTKIQQTPIKTSVVINQLGKQVVTDIGTGAAEKLAQRLINKVCQKIVRSGFTMEKQVLKQFVQNSIKNQTEKKLLAELGILTGQNLSRQIAKAAALKMEQNIITNLGKQIFKDSANVLQRQALKHLGEQGIKRFGTQAARQAQIQIAAKSLSSGTIYVEGMLTGLAKSIIFQIFLSALLASGITDGWIMKPHFRSKKLDLKVYNCEGILQPQPFNDFTYQQIKNTQSEYKFFLASFKQFKSLFTDKL